MALIPTFQMSTYMQFFAHRFHCYFPTFFHNTLWHKSIDYAMDTQPISGRLHTFNPPFLWISNASSIGMTGLHIHQKNKFHLIPTYTLLTLNIRGLSKE